MRNGHKKPPKKRVGKTSRIKSSSTIAAAKQPTPMTTASFLARMFARASGDYFVVSYANLRHEKPKYPPRDIVTRDLKEIERFLKRYDVPGRAIYFSVATMRGGTRSKEEIEEIVLLHVDLDFKGIVEDEQTIRRILAGLKCAPSVVVFSGHGLHCYWLYTKPLGPEQIESHEALLKRLCAILAGDKSVAEASRVLRLPGSHNSKFGEWRDVEVVEELSSWQTYPYSQIDKWINNEAPLLNYIPEPTAPNKQDNDEELNGWQRFRKKHRAAAGADIDQLLDEMVCGSTQGNGIDDTFTTVIGTLVKDESMTLEQVINRLLRPTRDAYERNPKFGPWSDKIAISVIREKFKRFKRKDAEAGKLEQQAAEAARVAIEAATRAAAASRKPLNSKSHDFDTDLPEDKTPSVDPFNPFEDILTPALPRGALPGLIEDVAFDEALRMGCDPGVLAMTMLTMCAGVIPDQLRIKVKKAVTDRWYQSARIWLGVIGTASTKKSPAMELAASIVRVIDNKLRNEFNQKDAAYKQWKTPPKEEREKHPMDPPVEQVLLISDISPEKAASLMIANPQGLLYVSDELTGFFGGLDRYGKGGAGMSSRSMWLSAFNGLGQPVDREGRRAPSGLEMGASIAGSIQPDVISTLVDEGSKNDGLVQRVLFIYSRKGIPGLDIDVAHPIDEYEDLITNLYNNMPCKKYDFHFSEKAHEFKEISFGWIEFTKNQADDNNPPLASHLGKWENYFVRLCLLFHVIDNWSDKHPRGISKETVQRVDRLMRDYLIPHAEAFYRALASDDEISQIKRACKHILVSGKSTVTVRDLQRFLGRNKKVTRQDMEKVGSKLETYDWLVRIAGKHNQSNSIQWRVRPEVFTRLAKYIPIFKAEAKANIEAMKANFAARKNTK